jgi:hypothetical protein
MSDYSTSPQDLLLANQQKGYVGIHIEQGVPVLDRDLNLLHDLITATLRSVITNYVGNGIAAGAYGFAILALSSPQNSQNFKIANEGVKPGKILVGGIEVSLAATMTYAAQPGVPPLTTPSAAQPDPRADTVYLDVFFTEVDSTVDPDLGNSHDVGMETSVRLKPSWVVLVAEGVPVPAAPAGHVYYPLARLQRPRGKDAIDPTMITDLRQSHLTVSDMERRLSLIEKLLLLPVFAAPGAQIIPKSGIVGEAIDLKGRNFDIGTPQVTFGAVPATLSGAFTASDVRVLVPNLAPGTYSVSISNSGGGPVTADDPFIVVAGGGGGGGLAPTFSTASPFIPKSGSAGATITLAGTNFDQPGLAVSFDATAATVLNSSATQISVRVPAIAAGNHTITVTTNAGSIASPSQFTVV